MIHCNAQFEPILMNKRPLSRFLIRISNKTTFHHDASCNTHKQRRRQSSILRGKKKHFFIHLFFYSVVIVLTFNMNLCFVQSPQSRVSLNSFILMTGLIGVILIQMTDIVFVFLLFFLCLRLSAQTRPRFHISTISVQCLRLKSDALPSVG